MKRIILLAVVAVTAQAVYAQNVQFGIKAGVNISNFKYDPDQNSDAKVGLNIGGLAHIHLSQQWALQPEVVYSMQGAEFGDTKAKVNYVNIPLLGQYMFGEGFRIETGPQLGILTSSKAKINDVEVDYKDATKKTDVAWAFGAGYISKMGLGVDARYNLGISDISKTEATDQKNRVWQLGLFYQFKH